MADVNISDKVRLAESNKPLSRTQINMPDNKSEWADALKTALGVGAAGVTGGVGVYKALEDMNKPFGSIDAGPSGKIPGSHESMMYMLRQAIGPERADELERQVVNRNKPKYPEIEKPYNYKPGYNDKTYTDAAEREYKASGGTKDISPKAFSGKAIQDVFNQAREGGIKATSASDFVYDFLQEDAPSLSNNYPTVHRNKTPEEIELQKKQIDLENRQVRSKIDTLQSNMANKELFQKLAEEKAANLKTDELRNLLAEKPQTPAAKLPISDTEKVPFEGKWSAEAKKMFTDQFGGPGVYVGQFYETLPQWQTITRGEKITDPITRKVVFDKIIAGDLTPLRDAVYSSKLREILPNLDINKLSLRAKGLDMPLEEMIKKTRDLLSKVRDAKKFMLR